ncbi:MAG: hypothetical protein QNJ81_09680 [Acidimicrobiia bacterium]|nr:hypothetical protein [Acidimicrobiia bacterium]
MTNELEAIERDAYRASYSDGIIDIFVGLSLVVIGATWIWAEDYGSLAGVLPAVMVPTVIPLRKRVVETRGGYVKWSAPRRRWEQRNLVGVFVAGVATFLLGIAAYFMFESGGAARDLLTDIAPGMLAFILAVLALVLGAMMEQRRFFIYGAVLVAGGVLAVIEDANPGLPLLMAGVVVTAVGVVMLVRYLRANPRVDA